MPGERFGLGREGSFGSDPYVGILPWARELLAWWDAQEVRAVHALVLGSPNNYAQCTLSNRQEARLFANQVLFFSHGIIVGKPGEAHFSENIANLKALEPLEPLEPRQNPGAAAQSITN